MEKSASIKGPTILDSPVPFAVMGPLGMHRGVLIRSGGVTLDVIGLDGLDDEISDQISFRSDVLRSFLFLGSDPNGTFHIARGPIDVAFSENDTRKSYLSFAWKGAADKRDKNAIRQQFSRSAVDLSFAIDRGDTHDIEFILSSTILLCRLANEKNKVRIFTFRVILSIYAVALLMGSIFYSLKILR